MILAVFIRLLPCVPSYPSSVLKAMVNCLCLYLYVSSEGWSWVDLLILDNTTLLKPSFMNLSFSFVLSKMTTLPSTRKHSVVSWSFS